MSFVKYQIFISSTYTDLKEERDQVIKACLEMGHIPVGMEMFSAANDEQWKIITRQIDDSDYFIVIVANRYGSVVNEISYTEKEYNYASEKGIPTLGFILDPHALWPTERSELDKKARSKLANFKKKVQVKPVKFWQNKSDLYAQTAISLGNEFAAHPRPGWSRTTSNHPIHNYEITNVYHGADPSLEDLKSENSRLRFLVFKLQDEQLHLSYPLNRSNVARIVLADGYVKGGTVKLWPIVRAVGGSTYWVQAAADIDNEGRWRAKVIFGTEGSSDLGAQYQLIFVINPKLVLIEGDELTALPPAEYKSLPTEVKRI